MYVLGVNSGWHDSSAALLKDGQLVVLIEQERISRTKHAFHEAPTEAIAACLREAGIRLDDVDAIAVGWDEPTCWKLKDKLFDDAYFRAWLLPAERLPHESTPPIQFVAHHLAHAASAFWTSGFTDAAVLVMDGRGETQATTMAVANSAGIEPIDEWDITQSLGNFYGFASEWAGLTFWGAGKLMGLAAYGRSGQPLPLAATESGYTVQGIGSPDPIVERHDDQQRDVLRRHFRQTNYPFCQPESAADIMAYSGFAASVQASLEEAVFQLARTVKQRSDNDRLVVVGGVGLNCTLNGRLARSGLFSDVYVPPVPHDVGVSLGAAMVADRERRADWAPMPRFEHAYWGVRPTSDEVEAAIQESGLPATRLPESALIDRVVQHLTAGHTVGWFQGKAEIGQRALGARSLLCDPRQRSQLVRVNTVKGREVWRPLAPSVLEEYAFDLFGPGVPSLANFMLAALPVRVAAQRSIPATVHIDGSARPQLVRRETNPRYWTLIDAFRRATGVPAVLNTSFNLAGEPIVHSPADAISSFTHGEVDILALEDYLLEKPASVRS